MSAIESDLKRVTSLGAPVLFADTCAIFDVMRDITRDTVLPHDRAAALALIEAMESGTQLVGFLADQVTLELNENIPLVEKDSENALNDLRKRMKRMDAVHAVYGGNGSTSIDHFNDHMTRAREVYERWVSASSTAKQATEIAQRALNRVNLARAPARKGNANVKDCVVIETYLDVASRLRSAGLSSKFVFLSSNTKDYADEARRLLKDDLASEFATMNIEYAPNFGAAKHALGL